MRSLKSLFLAAVVLFSASAPVLASYGDTVLADKPAAYWRLGESSGNIAHDSSGNGNDAIYSGPAVGQPGAIAGDPDSSMSFDSSDLIQRNDSTALLPGLDPWTVEAWVKVAATGKFVGFVNWYPGGYLWGHGSLYMLGITADGLPTYQLRDVNDTSLTVTGSTPITDASWHHVVGVLDRQGGSGRLYVDGTEVASAPVGAMGLIADTGIPLNLGHQYTFWGEPWQFVGMMDEVAIYRSALGIDQVRSHYATGRGLGSDSDGDGVVDAYDRCPGTPPGSTVDANGCITQCPSGSSQAQSCAAIQDGFNATLADKDALIAQKDATISSLNAEINLVTAADSAKDATIASLQAQIAALNLSLADKDAIIAALNASVAKLNASLADKDQTINQLQQQIAALNASIAALSSAVAAKDQVIVAANAQISTMFTRLQLDQAVLDAKASGQDALMTVLQANLRQVFGDPGFVLRGGTPIERINSLTNAIGNMPPGQIKKLHDLLAP